MEVVPVRLRREVVEDDRISDLVKESKAQLQSGDILVVSQKIVSKMEGRALPLTAIIPSALAHGIASEYGKDPRLVEAILSESRRIVRMKDGVIVTEIRNGMVCANAGVDESNVQRGMITLLPEDPDASARSLRSELKERLGVDVAVLVSDTFGRPFRIGQTDVAIGLSGMQAIRDYRTAKDTFGRNLRVTAIAVADELCAAAELVMGKTDGCPMAILRGYAFSRDGSAAHLVRPKQQDLFL